MATMQVQAEPFQLEHRKETEAEVEVKLDLGSRVEPVMTVQGFCCSEEPRGLLEVGSQAKCEPALFKQVHLFSSHLPATSSHSTCRQQSEVVLLFPKLISNLFILRQKCV